MNKAPTPRTVLLITEPEAAKALGICERKLWAMAASGEIPYVKLGRSKRYALTDLEAWIDANKKGGGPHA